MEFFFQIFNNKLLFQFLMSLRRDLSRKKNKKLHTFINNVYFLLKIITHNRRVCI